MPDMTAKQVIDDAYRKIGIEAPTSKQYTNALRDLQNMLSSWSAEGLHVPFYAKLQYSLVVGQRAYTIGSGGDFDTERPNDVMDAFIRIDNNDYPIDVFMTKEEQNSITNKSLQGRPTRLYYDRQYPLGKVKFNRAADTAYSCWLVLNQPLTNPTATTTTFSIPLEANQAIVYNLAILLSHDNDMQLPNSLFGIAEMSKETLMAMNSSDEALIYAKLDDITNLTYRGGSMDINTGG